MATLAKRDIRILETYLQMSGGHLLDFSHRTLAEFFEYYSIDIDEAQYQVGSGSKANRMRGFWQTNSDMVVGRVLKGLIEYYDEKRASGSNIDTSGYSDELRDKCLKIANQLSRGAYSAKLGSQLSYSAPTQQKTQQPSQALVKQYFQQPAPTEQPMNLASLASKQKVFIVHGHDDNLRMQIEIFVRTVGLDPIVLMNQASGGNTIIEKIEEYGDVDYAIVLYTPCDEGRNKGAQDLNGRARQNVVFEHGYFIARLGRKKVSAMVKPGVEIQNDIQGVVYIPTDKDWQTQLLKEFHKAGLEFNASKLYE
ncbi:TIR domain-containing protein [Shewanella frigidimarina]|uniref:TIR domain-containing protein n=1 Tax=Shewanella frigidimarina TaxID=56812 RepID=UPI003D7BB43D